VVRFTVCALFLVYILIQPPLQTVPSFKDLPFSRGPTPLPSESSTSSEESMGSVVDVPSHDYRRVHGMGSVDSVNGSSHNQISPARRKHVWM
jgi:hypothetical protein